MWGGKKDKGKPAQPAAAAPAQAPAAAPRPVEPPVAPPTASPSAVAAPKTPEAAAPGASVRAGEAPNPHLVLGQIMSVLMSSPQYANMPLGDARALVIPAIRTGQFLVASAQPKNGQPPAPLAVIMWAMVSGEVDARLTSDAGGLFRLAPNEWRSGDIAWLVAMAGDAQLLPHLVETLKKSKLGGKPLKGRELPAPPVAAS